jgi:hypothetical protein
VTHQTTIEQYGADVIYGFAALLGSFASRAAQPRLQKLFEPAEGVAARKRTKAQTQ